MSDGGDEDVEAFDIEDGEGDGYTETDHENLGDRLQGACAGICIGLLLFFGSFPLLFWNEDRAVERYDALNEAETQTLSINPSSINPANEGELLHFSVNITNGGDALVDQVFGIESGGLTFRRDAQMYQWTESTQTTSKKKVGGGKTTQKTYTYEKEWRSLLVDSQNFKQPSNHANPSYMEFEPATISADPILIGAYELPQELVGRIDWENQMSVGIDDITDQSIRSRAKDTSDGFYFGNSTSNPQIGDQTVSFSEAPASIITIVGVQNGKTLSAFVSETGDGGDILLFRQGSHSATAMFEEAKADNAAFTWILRFVGFILMALGLYLIFRPIEVFADIIPCVGSIIGCGIIFVSVLISAILSSITISIAWLVAHPKIGGIVLAVTLTVIGCCAFGVKKLGERKGKDVDDDRSSSSSSSEKVVADTLPTAYAMPEGKVEPDTAEPTVYSTPEPYNPDYSTPEPYVPNA
mmetsp:Transcript_41270/g.74385  ORF Transcript_41270/g.74385 Transcript_41270/m.74385 type:complete len:468 (-) Transcript_41270:84-1487(-)|eukprot:CAMPEP_0201869766 /NCGR_PEP_ID=MMETSP0902-20130614/3160_1 /ASSEMBLY_ACC=CAM_ASM_000551 /TAXON_ID=420261 /ORGANISM="Thalassiosira antarctica, Strain CCMP982" /LENGTH=467 /DNA_ID=CAMNT_0048395313 /DNA_START=153 /DNA_END=1556 /DNA_ORIENTATION=-